MCWARARFSARAGSEPVPDPGQAALGVLRPVREQAVVRFVPRCNAVVEPGPAAEFGFDVPVRERAVEQPGVVEGGIAHTHVTPVDHAGQSTLAHEQMLGTEVGVEERRLEVHERLRFAEQSLRLCAPVFLEERKHQPLELRALGAVGLDPIGTLHRKNGRVEGVERIEERADAFGVLVDERFAADQAVSDEERVAGDELERGNVHRERRSEHRQHRDLELERFLDPRPPRKAERPFVVDDRYLEVVSVVDLDDRPRTTPERVRDQTLAVGSHSPMVSDTNLGVYPRAVTEQIEIRRLDAAEAHTQLAGLAAVLVDCVAGGASVSYLAPFSHEEARAAFEAVATEVEQGRRLLLGAFVEGRLVGTVQVNLALPPNQPHRGEIAKLLVHRSARKRGIAQLLMEHAESEARAAGKTLLVLDTVTGDNAERLYTRLGWTRVGVIPGYALYPDGRPCDTTVFWKAL
jgi:GNAT superfamily N-acetyltransferase